MFPNEMIPRKEAISCCCIFPSIHLEPNNVKEGAAAWAIYIRKCPGRSWTSISMKLLAHLSSSQLYWAFVCMYVFDYWEEENGENYFPYKRNSGETWEVYTN